MRTKQQIQADIDFKRICSKIHCENKALAAHLGFFKTKQDLYEYNKLEEVEAKKHAEEIQQLEKEKAQCKM